MGDDKKGGKEKKMIGNYEMGELLGEGAFSQVRLGVDTRTKGEVAIKIVNQSLIHNIKDMERVCREIHVLKNIKHPNIIRLHEAIDKGTHVYLVMEHAAGGELYEYIAKNGPLGMNEAKRIFHQILSGVDYCHRQMISHRDLKPENVLLDKSMNAKVIDFGLSNDMQTGVLLKTTCGSPCYAAPEMILGKKYDGAAIDVWSCGVILYCIVIGCLPFNEENQPELFRKITNGLYNIPEDTPSDVADLIRQFLTVSFEKRITIAQAWQHPWLQSLNSVASLSGEDDFLMPGQGPPMAGLADDLSDLSLSGGGDDSELRPSAKDSEEVYYELLPHHALSASLLTGDRDDNGVIFMKMEIADTSQGAASAGAPSSATPRRRGAGSASPGPGASAPKDEPPPVAGGGGKGASHICTVFLPRKKEGTGASPRVTVDGSTPSSSLLRTGAAGRGATAGRGTAVGGAAKKSTGAKSVIAATAGSSDRKPALPTAAKAASAAAARSRADDQVNEEVYNDPKLAGALLCAVTKKEPRVIVREIQKLFSDHKVLLRAASTTTIKGEKNRVRFELNTSQLMSVNSNAISGEPLYMVQASRLAGDIAAYREVCRKLLNKL